jgi:hypothetical protein
LVVKHGEYLLNGYSLRFTVSLLAVAFFLRVVRV